MNRKQFCKELAWKASEAGVPYANYVWLALELSEPKTENK
jgi:hypothetical protein